MLSLVVSRPCEGWFTLLSVLTKSRCKGSSLVFRVTGRHQGIDCHCLGNLIKIAGWNTNSCLRFRGNTTRFGMTEGRLRGPRCAARAPGHLRMRETLARLAITRVPSLTVRSRPSSSFRAAALFPIFIRVQKVTPSRSIMYGYLNTPDTWDPWIKQKLCTRL